MAKGCKKQNKKCQDSSESSDSEQYCNEYNHPCMPPPPWCYPPPCWYPPWFPPCFPNYDCGPFLPFGPCNPIMFGNNCLPNQWINPNNQWINPNNQWINPNNQWINPNNQLADPNNQFDSQNYNLQLDNNLQSGNILDNETKPMREYWRDPNYYLNKADQYYNLQKTPGQSGRNNYDLATPLYYNAADNLAIKPTNRRVTRPNPISYEREPSCCGH